MNGIDFPNEVLSQMWEEIDWKKIEEELFGLQQNLSKIAMTGDKKAILKFSSKIVNSVEAKVFAVRRVSEQLNSAAGIDGVRWITSAEKMKAALELDPKNYKAKPFRHFVIVDKGKERRINVPTVSDRAMQILFMLVLDPISEATADRKSFAFRKGRSTFDVHSLIMHILDEKDNPEWVLLCDVKSFYDSISHAWLLDNIPMDKGILREMLQAGVIFNGELFPTDEGISLGNNISTILGNMTLDGIQKLLYDLQGSEIKDYYNGYVIRFADDILITARTKEDAEKFLEYVEKYVYIRGLRLSPNKTKIVNVSEGFDYLSRHYYKKDGISHSKPSDKSIMLLENSLTDLILSNDRKISQKRLIESINAKLNGWATYQRVTEARDSFRHIDNFVTTLLLRMMREMYTYKPLKQLIDKYWYKDVYNRHVFCLPKNKNVRVIFLSDIPLVHHKRLDIKKNYYLDKEYFDERTKLLEIEKISGKYKSIWLRQGGLCYNCGRSIGVDQPRTIIIKNPNSDRVDVIRNMAYVHSFCSGDETFFLNREDLDGKRISIKELIDEINDPESYRVNKTEGTFRNLYDYFVKEKRKTFRLSFEEIEEILGRKLCNTAYKYRSYWWRKTKWHISHCWLKNGYIIRHLNLKGQEVIFSKVEGNETKLEIPGALMGNNIPKSAKVEAEKFLEYIVEKYKL